MGGFFMSQFFKNASHKTICKCVVFNTLSPFYTLMHRLSYKYCVLQFKIYFVL